MVKYNGLAQFKVLLLGTLLLGAASALAAITPAPGSDAAAAAPASDSKPSPPLREQAPMHYVVKKGDTLWGIANHFLLNAWQWPEIWYENGQVRNPHKIYPGDVLTLMIVNGRPQMVQEPTHAEEDRLSPQVRASALSLAIPAIPIEAIRDFLHSPRLVTEDQLKQAPYLLDFVDEHLIAGTAAQVYVRKLPEHGGSTDYSVVRVGQIYRDPDSHDLLGYEVLPIGEAEIQRKGDPGVALLTKTTREALAGDYFIPVDPESFDAYFYPHAPAQDVRARIISVYDGVTEVGQYQVVTINRGGRDGIEPGHVLSIMQSNRIARDPHSATGRSSVKLPDLQAGTMMVFKVAPRVSFALVMEATRPVRILDKAVTPAAD
jgi:LysM repeat protein